MSWQVFQRWFNLRPRVDADHVVDDHGEKFWIVWRSYYGRGPQLFLYHRGEWVGTVESAWNDKGGLQLGDIIIFEQHQHLRRRGLGKKMMQLFIERAKQEQAKFIRGHISPDESTTEEYLIEWYKRQGFDVFETRHGLFRILLQLQNKRSVAPC